MLSEAEAEALGARMGHGLLQRRIAMESEQDAHHYRRRSDSFRLEHLASAGPLIRAVLAATGMRARGRRNALAIQVRRNEVRLPRLPRTFDGFTLLHLSDLHLDLGEAHLRAVIDRTQGVACDACVLTGDYRFHTSGPSEPALAALARLAPALPEPAYAVLGNHDGIRTVAGLESLGIRVLMNERATLERGGERIHLAGIDDAHYFRTHDLGRAAAGVLPEECAILLSHTPQPYDDAVVHGFSLMLCGHTHGGQICLPGGIPIVTDCPAPRRFARGAWRYATMAGYTSSGCGSSIVDARFNCPPEITLHTLRCGQPGVAG